MTRIRHAQLSQPDPGSGLRVLLVEDSAADAELITRSLEFASGRRWPIEHVPTLTRARERLAEARYGTVLVDYRLPDGSAQDLVAEMKQLGDYAPVIVITGLRDEALARAMLGLGAEDYVSKDDLDGQVLLRAITYACARHRMRSELAQQNRLLEDLVRARTREVMEVQDLERSRLAEALHDESGQWMTALLAQLTAAERGCADDATYERIATCRKLCEGAMAEISRICRHLHPAVIEAGGLVGALHSWHAPEAEPRVLVKVAPLDGVELSVDVQMALYRCAQEAITNARKHARANTVRVTLERRQNQLELSVRDDGIGLTLAPNAALPTGIGLVGMRHRMEQVSGRVEVARAAPHGTLVTVRVPI